MELIPERFRLVNLPSQPSFVNIGDLDVPGHLITVEALINRTTPYSGGALYAGDVVSKHKDPTTVNYLLRPNSAEITTNNGYFKTPDICEIQLNKTYHLALVYDGVTLKFYRNGFLMSQIAATGDLYQNDFPTQIGLFSSLTLPTQMVGYVNEVKIWNVARTQAQIQANMNSSLPSPAAQAGLLAYYTFDGLTNKQGNPAWNGSLGGSAQINQANPTCSSFAADSCGITVCPSAPDFSFNQNVCNILKVSLAPVTTSDAVYDWAISDGATYMQVQNPVHVFSQPGIYQVSLTVSFPSGCSSTVTKSMAVQSQRADIIRTKETTICWDNGLSLRTQDALDFCWSPTDYLDNPNAANSTASPPVTTKYYFTAKITGTNLITNGDFEGGNAGFTSGYVYDAVNNTEGEYVVGTNPQTWNQNMGSCGDHTSGKGKLMIVNGNPVAGVTVWNSKSLTVTPNTNYAFSAWVQSVYISNLADLQFSINGTFFWSQIMASPSLCSWHQFYTTWNSGSNSTVVVSLVNLNTFTEGNDFALDDISFGPLLVQMDSVTLMVDKPVITAFPDTTVCPGMPVPLRASGTDSYSWTPASGLSDASIADPVALPAGNTLYTVTGTNHSGCSATTSINVYLFPSLLSVSADTSICWGSAAPLHATGGTTYSWSPAVTLDDPSRQDPVAQPNVSTRYYVSTTDINTCPENDSILVNVYARPLFHAPPDEVVCHGFSVKLVRDNDSSFIYSWSPSTGLDDVTAPYPTASPAADIVYMLQIHDAVCTKYDSSFSVSVSVNPSPNVTVQKANDIDCSIATSRLTAGGALYYSWTPVSGLDNPRVSDPLASIDTTTTFVVKGTDENGCYTMDSVKVTVTATGKNLFIVPNAFSPNRNGHNDCFSIQRWGDVMVEEFTIFIRWGQRVFTTRNPSECWDGRLKGSPQAAGTYVYVIRAKSFCGMIDRTGTVMPLR